MRVIIVLLAVGLAACQEGAADTGDVEVAEAPAVQSPVKAFCVSTLARTAACFRDDAFWDGLATMYFASLGQPVDDETKQAFIGNLKDDMVKLQTERAFEDNCDRMIEGQKLPTAAQMAAVTATEGGSCTEYAGKLGFLI